MKNSSFEKLVENKLITVAETIDRNQVLTLVSNKYTESMVVSEKFYLKTVKVNSFYESKRYVRRSASFGPVIVDLGGSKAFIIDGAHRWLEAHNRGEKTMKAWVGEKALDCLEYVEENKTDHYDDFYDLIKNSKKIALFSHSNPDADAIGSTIGIQWLLKSFDIESTIFYCGKISNPQYKEITRKFVSFEHYVKQDYDLTIVCDTTTENPNQFDIIIDHHRVVLNDYQGLYIEVEAGSCCSIVCDIIKRFCDVIDPKVAAALLAGIRDDTQDLTSNNIMDIDFESYQFLFDFTDRSLLKKTQSKICTELKTKAYNDVKIIDQYAIVNLGVIPSDARYVVEIIANDLSLWDGIEIAACHAIIDGVIYGFLRSVNEKLNLDSLCKKLGRSTKIGSGKIGEGSYQHVLSSIDESQRIKTLLKVKLFV